MQITAATLAAIAGTSVNANMASTVAGLELAGVGAGLNRPHRLAQYLAQLAHESGGWRYDRELWSTGKPTAAQSRYEGRADLGNTQPGDGYKFRGRGPIQSTGRDNYRKFTAWAQKLDPRAPDFEAVPDAVNTDPWEGLVAIWYWSTRDLNRYADTGDLLTITKRINGGTNGLKDRQDKYTRAGLILLSFATIKQFQMHVGLAVDGIAGPQTRAAIHAELLKRPLVTFEEAPRPAPKPTPAPTIKPAPYDPPARGTGSSIPVALVVAGVIAAIAAVKFLGG